ncbi:MAG: hypothetical protein FWG89_10975 [Treponema sp.]|nr:hypothetical protein [Treponema sp.]
MKNIIKARIVPFFGITVLVAVIGFSMAACGDGNSPPPSFSPRYLGATLNAGGEKMAAAINITSDQGKDPRSLANGWYEYTVELSGVIISQGVVQVVNGVYTFYEGATLSFSYNSNTNVTTGKISLSQAIQDALDDLGATLGDEVDVEQITEMETGSYWSGVYLWGVKVVSGDQVRDGESSISFNGMNYVLTDKDGNTETGTYFFTTPGSSGDNLFIFFRKDKDPEIAVYLYEGEKTTDFTQLEFYNHIFDPMLISRTNDDIELSTFLSPWDED